eukprot:gene17745-23343_t
MAFHRTIKLLVDRADVHPALKKLWKKHYNVDGQVTQHLSPFEQNIVTPMIKDAPMKIYKKVKDFLFEAGPAIIFGIAVYVWAESEHKRIAFEHRV